MMLDNNNFIYNMSDFQKIKNTHISVCAHALKYCVSHAIFHHVISTSTNLYYELYHEKTFCQVVSFVQYCS